MTKTFKLRDLDCAHCAKKIEDAVAKLDGVDAVSVNFMREKMTVTAADEVFDQVMQQAVKIATAIEPDCTLVL